MEENKQTYLKNLAKSLGADLVGFCELGENTSSIAKNLTCGISIGVKLSSAVLKTIDSAPTYVYFQHYRTANTLLDQITFRLAREIEKLGFSALPVAGSQSQGKENPYSGVIPHKTVAVLSGLGFVGKSGLFLSTEYGSQVRLGTILTDMPLKSELPLVENGCGKCDLCAQNCPAGAIYGTLPTTDGKRNFDAEKCSRDD